jgi:excinuclease UvrABC ATPase subunit
VHGARVNNLKDVSVEIPKRRLTVFTGVSGSGKSSLVFGTIAAESQRLINETYSAFVQGFMPTLARPDVDVLDGLTTAIIVDQERMGADPRSTVGTATDANAMLRILFSRLGQPHIGPPGAFAFNVPSVRASGGITIERGGKTRTEKATYSRTGGMCPRCEGRGSVTDIDLTALYDDGKSLNEGALSIPGYTMDGWYGRIFRGAGFFDPDKPIRKYTKRELHDLLHKEPTKIKVDGINLTYAGLIPSIQKSFLSKDVDAMQPHIRAFVERAVTFATCPECDGTRLSEAARSSKIEGVSIADACAMQISDLAAWVGELDEPSVAPLLGALQHTLDSFAEIGLGYLSLDRPAGTLSGGEAQRVKMIRHLGSSLTDVTYVFDEPTIGLHPHDIQRMNELLLQLRDKGNTVLVVEHKPEAIAIGDHVVDLGPGAGTGGGEVVFEGTVEGLRASDTLTGRHLDDRAALKPSVRTPVGLLEVRGADTHNLQDVDVDIPLGVLVRRHRGGGLGQELAHPRLRVRPGRGGGGRPGADPRLATKQPGDVHRPARPDPQGVREGQRRQARAVQRQLRGRLSRLQRRRRHLHRPGDDGRRRHHLRGVRGASGSRHRCWNTSLGGRDISEVLAISVTEAQEFFGAGEAATPRATRSWRGWRTSGSGYLSLGQPLTTLSGGERQRLKLGHPHGGKGGVYVLDEPTTGLHLADVEQLLGLLDRLADSGKVGHRHRAPPGGHGARRLDHRPRPRRRPRRRPDRLRGTPRRPGRRPLHAHRRAPGRLRRQLSVSTHPRRRIRQKQTPARPAARARKTPVSIAWKVQ